MIATVVDLSKLPYFWRFFFDVKIVGTGTAGGGGK